MLTSIIIYIKYYKQVIVLKVEVHVNLSTFASRGANSDVASEKITDTDICKLKQCYYITVGNSHITEEQKNIKTVTKWRTIST